MSTYSFSPSSNVYDTAMANWSPVDENERALILVEKEGSWQIRFLLRPSQILTRPSPPPVAKVPNLIQVRCVKKLKILKLLYSTPLVNLPRMKFNHIDRIHHICFGLILFHPRGAMTFKGIFQFLHFRSHIEIFHRHTAFSRTQCIT